MGGTSSFHQREFYTFDFFFVGRQGRCNVNLFHICMHFHFYNQCGIYPYTIGFLRHLVWGIYQACRIRGWDLFLAKKKMLKDWYWNWLHGQNIFVEKKIFFKKKRWLCMRSFFFWFKKNNWGRNCVYRRT